MSYSVILPTLNEAGHIIQLANKIFETLLKTNEKFEIIIVDVPASSSFTFEVNWVPKYSGTAWIEVSSPGGLSERTDAIQVEKGESTFIIESLDGASNSMLTGFGVIAFLMLGLLGYLVVTGKKDSYEEYDESDYI